MNQVIAPVSTALGKMITTDQLIQEIGLLALVNKVELKTYMNEKAKTEIFDTFLKKERSFFIIHDDFFLNDHLVLGINSPLLDAKNNFICLLLPAILVYTKESLEQIDQLTVLFNDDQDKDAFKDTFIQCLDKCNVMQQFRVEGFGVQWN
jgi:hypothetical protein